MHKTTLRVLRQPTPVSKAPGAARALQKSQQQSAGELARSPGRRAWSALRHINIAQQVGAEPARGHGVELLADPEVIRMCPRAEAEAGPAPHGLLGELDHRADLRKIRHARERIESRPDALNRISQGLPDFPARLGQCFGEIGVPVIAHVRIVSPGRGPGLGTYTQTRLVSVIVRILLRRLAAAG